MKNKLIAVAVVIASAPWVAGLLHKVFSSRITTPYDDYCAWVMGIFGK